MINPERNIQSLMDIPITLSTKSYLALLHGSIIFKLNHSLN